MDDYRLRIDRAIAVLDEHFSEEISLERLAAAAGFSPYHFHRIFAAQMGETPDDFVGRLRLERAANYLIKHRERSITEVALLCGYASPAGFARAFKKRFGTSAREFRRQETDAFQAIAQAAAGHLASPSQALDPDQKALQASMLADLRVRELPLLRLAYITSRSGYDLAAICDAWERLYRWAAGRNLLNSETQMIGISFDDPYITAKTHCRYYAGMSVAQKPKLTQPVGYMELPAGHYACCCVDCTPDQIEAVYHTLYGAWMPSSGLMPADSPTYEVYHATPETHPRGLLTIEVRLPVES